MEFLFFDLYFYDFSQCYYNLLVKINFQFPKNLNIQNKQERNIFIGKLQKENKTVYNYLSNTVDKLLDFYIEENNLNKDDIIIRQKDGIITKKKLQNIDQFLKLDFRGYISFLLFDITHKRFLYLMDDKINVKGIPNFYNALDDLYQDFKNFNFYDKKLLFKQLYNFKNKVLDQNLDFYKIPKDDFYVIKVKNGFVKYQQKIKYDIDKLYYFDTYFKLFCDTLVLLTY